MAAVGKNAFGPEIGSGDMEGGVPFDDFRWSAWNSKISKTVLDR